MLRDWIINLLLEGVRIPVSSLQALIDTLDEDRDGMISLREIYQYYRNWRDS